MRRIEELNFYIGPMISLVSLVVRFLIEDGKDLVFVLLHHLNWLNLSVIVLVCLFQGLECVDFANYFVVKIPIELRVDVCRLDSFERLEDLEGRKDLPLGLDVVLFEVSIAFHQIENTLVRSLIVAEINLEIVLFDSQQLCLDFLLRDLFVENVLVLFENQELFHYQLLLLSPQVLQICLRAIFAILRWHFRKLCC